MISRIDIKTKLCTERVKEDRRINNSVESSNEYCFLWFIANVILLFFLRKFIFNAMVCGVVRLKLFFLSLIPISRKGD